MAKETNELNCEIIKNIEWADEFALECCGVELNVRTDCRRLKAELRGLLPFVNQQSEFAPTAADTVTLITGQAKLFNGLFFNDERAMDYEVSNENFFEFAADKILMILALISLPSKIYLHAGAVVWKNLGILLPAASFAGKTTLVREFIEAGADFYSDDCIILDAEQRMHPFPRDLAIRTEHGRVHRNARYFNAKNGVGAARVDLIIFAEYAENAGWRGHRLSGGTGVLKLMDNFYNRSTIGLMPEQIIKTLTKLIEHAQIFGGRRGAARQVVEWVEREFLR